ncbi:threonine synthase [Anoxybacter fermentans]|uniref:Threonine synthase n=1 Tax=Anoxybacter fermentans TaxID=1323375 RepID=A0A3Q9HNP1_9FIRM|nr:threonine synthase [Anoxybacter fermentans]AZR72124.1 threonine synthase [Anoxybacter fermentans]
MQSNFVCYRCEKKYSLDKPIWRCECGGLLKIERRFKTMEIQKEDLSLWRYRDLLPVEQKDAMITLGEGMTPLLQRMISGYNIYLKMEFLSPTGSFKDRGAAVLLSKIKEWGIDRIVEDSSGNAGAAIAAYSAAAGVQCEIYLPEKTSEGKIKQIEAYGSSIKKIPGERDAVSRAVMEAAESVYYASHSWNPLFFEGTKTMAFEIWEQLGYQAPEFLVIPVGNGTMLLGAFIGFMDLLKMGQIEKLPRFIAVQSANCAPIYARFYGLELKSIKPTVAEGISVGEPVRIDEIVEAVRETGGEVVTVTDKEVLKGVRELSRMGIYVEPTSGTVVAGFYQAIKKGLIKLKDKVILPLTGNGLKKG